MMKIIRFIIRILKPTIIKNFIYRLFYIPLYLFNINRRIAVENSDSQKVIIATALFYLLNDNYGVIVGNFVVANINDDICIIPLDYLKIDLNKTDIVDGIMVYITNKNKSQTDD